MNLRKRILVGVATAGAVLVFGYCGLALLTPRFGRIIAYSNTQPALRIVPAENPAPPAEVERIRQLAIRHLEVKPDIQRFYWPEPSVITEHPHCWLITFARKDPVYRWLGFEIALRPTDRVMFLTQIGRAHV